MINFLSDLADKLYTELMWLDELFKATSVTVKDGKYRFND